MSTNRKVRIDCGEKNTFKKKKSKGLPAVFGYIKIASLERMERMEIVKDIEVV